LPDRPAPTADLVGDPRAQTERDDHECNARERHEQSEMAVAGRTNCARKHDTEHSGGEQRPSLHNHRERCTCAEMTALLRQDAASTTE
jgi:hypothetical protein